MANYTIQFYEKPEQEGDSGVLSLSNFVPETDGTIATPYLRIDADPGWLIRAEDFNIAGFSPNQLDDSYTNNSGGTGYHKVTWNDSYFTTDNLLTSGVSYVGVQPEGSGLVTRVQLENMVPDAVESGVQGNWIRVTLSLSSNFEMPSSNVTISIDFNGTAIEDLVPLPPQFRWILTNGIWPNGPVLGASSFTAYLGYLGTDKVSTQIRPHWGSSAQSAGQIPHGQYNSDTGESRFSTSNYLMFPNAVDAKQAGGFTWPTPYNLAGDSWGGISDMWDYYEARGTQLMTPLTWHTASYQGGSTQNISNYSGDFNFPKGFIVSLGVGVGDVTNLEFDNFSFDQANMSGQLVPPSSSSPRLKIQHMNGDGISLTRAVSLDTNDVVNMGPSNTDYSGAILSDFSSFDEGNDWPQTFSSGIMVDGDNVCDKLQDNYSSVDIRSPEFTAHNYANPLPINEGDTPVYNIDGPTLPGYKVKPKLSTQIKFLVIPNENYECLVENFDVMRRGAEAALMFDNWGGGIYSTYSYLWSGSDPEFSEADCDDIATPNWQCMGHKVWLSEYIWQEADFSNPNPILNTRWDQYRVYSSMTFVNPVAFFPEIGSSGDGAYNKKKGGPRSNRAGWWKNSLYPSSSYNPSSDIGPYVGLPLEYSFNTSTNSLEVINPEDELDIYLYGDGGNTVYGDEDNTNNVESGYYGATNSNWTWDGPYARKDQTYDGLDGDNSNFTYEGTNAVPGSRYITELPNSNGKWLNNNDQDIYPSAQIILDKKQPPKVEADTISGDSIIYKHKIDTSLQFADYALNVNSVNDDYPVKHIILKQLNLNTSDDSGSLGVKKCVEVSIVLNPDWTWNSQQWQMQYHGGNDYKYSSFHNSPPAQGSGPTVFLNQLFGEPTIINQGSQMPFNINLIDALQDNNSGTMTITSYYEYPTNKTIKREGFRNQETIYNIKGKGYKNKECVVATIKFDAKDGKYFSKIPHLTYDINGSKINSDFSKNLKLVPKKIKNTHSSTNQDFKNKIDRNNIQYKERKITTRVFDLVYINNNEANDVSFRPEVFSGGIALNAYLHFKEKQLPNVVSIVSHVDFGGDISEHGGIRDIKLYGVPGTSFVLTLTDHNDDSILLPNSTTTTREGYSKEISCINGIIKRNGQFHFKQKFPKIPLIKTTAVNDSGATSGATRIIFDDLTGVEVGDKLIASGVKANEIVKVTAINPTGGNANQCDFSSSVTVADNTPVSFRRQTNYKLNITPSSVLGSNIPKTDPTYIINQYTNPTLTLKASAGTTYAITHVNGVATSFSDGDDHSSSYTGRPGKTLSQLENISSVKKNVSIQYTLNGKGTNAFSARTPFFSNQVGFIKAGEPNASTPTYAGGGSDWTNTVSSENGGTHVQITSSVVLSADGGTANGICTITLQVSIDKWGTEDVTMDLDLDRVLTAS